jgi:hypothetical protein
LTTLPPEKGKGKKVKGKSEEAAASLLLPFTFSLLPYFAWVVADASEIV